MRIPRPPLVALPSRPSRPPWHSPRMQAPSLPQERAAGTSGAKTYHRLAQAKKSDYVKLDLLALNDFHGNLEPPTGSSGNIPGITNVTGTKAGGAAYLASPSRRSARSRAPRAPRR